MKEIERVKADASKAELDKSEYQKKVQKLLDNERKLEEKISTCNVENEKSEKQREVINAKLAEKKCDIEVLQRKVNIQEKVYEMTDLLNSCPLEIFRCKKEEKLPLMKRWRT